MENLEVGFMLTVVGMGIVFAVLALIVGIIALMSRLDQRWQAAEKSAREQTIDAEPRIDHLTAVLIAAACATYIGGRVHVRSVRRLLSADAASSPWSAQGRAVLQGSHVVTRRSATGRDRN